MAGRDQFPDLPNFRPNFRMTIEWQIGFRGQGSLKLSAASDSGAFTRRG